MIIEMVMNVIYSVFALLTSPIDIPNLPSNVSNVFDSTVEYISAGIGILSNFTHYNYLIAIFAIIVAIDVGLHLYQFVMYILRKIPFLGIK